MGFDGHSPRTLILNHLAHVVRFLLVSCCGLAVAVMQVIAYVLLQVRHGCTDSGGVSCLRARPAAACATDA
jgi:hypothetical protein